MHHAKVFLLQAGISLCIADKTPYPCLFATASLPEGAAHSMDLQSRAKDNNQFFLLAVFFVFAAGKR